MLRIITIALANIDIFLLRQISVDMPNKEWPVCSSVCGWHYGIQDVHFNFSIQRLGLVPSQDASVAWRKINLWDRSSRTGLGVV